MTKAMAVPITATDADSHLITLNEIGKVSVIISSNQDIQKQTREAGHILDQFQGVPDFREMVVVDLRNSLGNVLPPLVRLEMRRNLDQEAKRIAPFFLANGSKENPRLHTIAVPDFNGKICDALGWTKPEPIVQVITFARSGEVAFRWAATDDKVALQGAVRGLLQSH
jgi:hypothetical protein